jgi:SAM-dependent methyltransferase
MNQWTRDSEDRAVLKALESSYRSIPIAEARDRQDEILLRRFQGLPLAIADVGCGTGYHGTLFAPGCRSYHGYEIAPETAKIARDSWQQEGLDNAELFLGNVAESSLDDRIYDLVLCLYFTPGNFREPSDDLGMYTDEYLDRNPVFIAIFSKFYQALVPGGQMFLTVYKDVPETEAAQFDFYKHTGQTVITPPGSRFVATAQGFWSARWSQASLLSNLAACGIAESAVTLHDLNHIAWLVEISK